ncbi:MAG: MG2 domain-containing protein [Bacteroidales bacterium]|jgi:uncharacterized protein YfaS (alpha-2-macroglobulin family)|nr:MG2 domain-containing protein [Bacteroidales bacterium]
MNPRFPLLIAVFAALLVSCDSGRKPSPGTAVSEIISSGPELPPDAGFGDFIASYTSGIIPSNGIIEIRLTPEFAGKASRDKTSSLFSFEPSVKGTAEWTDDFTLIFKPAKNLLPGTTYRGTLNLGKIGEVPDRLTTFPFRIQTLKRDFRISISNIETEMPGGKTYSLNGELTTSDFMEGKEVEKLLSLTDGRTSLPVVWEHPETGNLHLFTVKNITRGKEQRDIRIDWDGSRIGIKEKGSAAVSIPAAGVFSLIDIRQHPGELQRIDIIFSDPVDPAQELEGLIRLSDRLPLTYETSANMVSVFPAEKLQGPRQVIIESVLRSNSGTTLDSTIEKTLNFTSIMPGVMGVGEGVILPASSGIIFPFRAAGLSAVDLTIIRIFTNNAPYFQQMNDITGSSYIKQYGRPVYRGKIELSAGGAIDLNTWNLFTIDLSDYVDVEPGAIYRVELGMRRSYSLYPCAEQSTPSVYEQMLDRLGESGWWDTPGDYWDEGEEWALFYNHAYNWRERENPCSEAYYGPDKKLTRNLLATNIGLMAKQGSDNRLLVTVSDITTAEPLPAVNIEAFDLQMQPTGSGTSDNDGFAVISTERKPFLIIASAGGDINYLRLHDGSSLSVSSFDVAGSVPEKGLKAFIYGERDVWRPGDTIYLSMFLREMNLDIPQDHPVQFELLNPDGQRVDFQISSVGGRNLFTFITRTPDNAITGNYNAVVRIGGASFSKRIRIETVKPNRLKIDLSFDNSILGGDRKDNRADLNARWLSGAVSGNLNAIVELLLKPVKTTFEGYSQYVFDCPVTEFWPETQTVFDGKTDDKGNASFRIAPGKDMRPAGMLMAQFTTRVFEKGGDASIMQTNIPCAPYPVFAGLNFPGLTGTGRILYTDVDNQVNIITLNHEGKPVRSEVEINIYKLSYRWWWESGDEQLGYYVSNNYYKPVFTEKITTSSSGEGSVQFFIPKEEWGRYLVRASVPSGHSTGKILLVDWPWDYGAKTGAGDAATVLSLACNKEKYAPGENIEISFPAPDGAKAIVTLENAGGIIDRFRTDTKSPNTVINIKATPGMAPNIYVYVTLIQQHAQTANDMPVRLYGIVPVMVEDPGTRLMPVIDMADEVRSEKTFEVKVSEASGRAMSYTLAVVDEGLLDITGYRTPDPWSRFYAREALGVKTWDIYDYILGAFGGRLEKIFTIGGDEALPDRASQKVNRFRPVVRFIGPVKLDAGKTNTHTIGMPRYTGSVRVMLVGGSSKAYGSAEKQLFVRDPLMLLATAPRVLSPGETVTLPVTLFVQDDKIRSVTVTASGNERISFASNRQDVEVKGMGETDLGFIFTASEKQGRGEIRVVAEGDGERAEYSFEIEIRSPNPPETRTLLTVLKKGEKMEKSIVPFGIDGTNSASLEISSLPSVNLGERLDYLTGYPHGCTEQIISAAFPQLYLKQLFRDDRGLMTKTSANVLQAINILMSRQMTDGSMALWPGSSYQPDLWITSWAGHFMTEASRNGYNIPSSFMNRWLSFQRREAQQWRWDEKYKQTAIVQAYRLYTLALAGSPERGAMNRLRETPGLPRIAGWFLAGSYALSGRPEAATELIDVRTLATEEEYTGWYYGSGLRDKAVILHTLLLLKNEEQALILLRDICDQMSGTGWFSTQSTAWGLYAWMKYVEVYGGAQEGEAKFAVTLNGRREDNRLADGPVYKQDIEPFISSNSLIVENNSESPLYVTLVMKGVPAAGVASAEDRNLAMRIEYTDPDGKKINHTELKQGTDFMMVTRVTNNSYRAVSNIALTQMMPSGWEIRNTRLFEVTTAVDESTYDYRDFRDDRINTYFSLGPGETKTFVALLNASYSGEFNQPAIWCEAMYDGNYYARVPGEKVKVTR